MRKLILVCGVGWVVGCGTSNEPQERASSSSQALSACGSQSLHVNELRADFREIWKGLENAASGKQASPFASATLELNAAVQPNLVSGSYDPVVRDGSCGGSVPTELAGAVIASRIWGKATSNASRAPEPETFNVLALESISGVVSSAGPIAAGGDITVSSMSINSPARQKFGVIAGGKVTLTSGAIAGDLSYGVASTVPQTVSVSGQKSLQRFLVGDAFQSLAEVSSLVGAAPAPGTAQLAWSTLTLSGTSTGVNLFRVSPTTLEQARTIEIKVPTGAAVIVDVTGLAPQLVSKGVSLQGATPNRLLWSFSHATSLTVGSISLPGSILAPHARLSFPSGDINGTVVVKSFSSPGSGSLRYAPLDAAAVFGALSPRSVTLMPAAPLKRGCSYTLNVPNTLPFGVGSACLDAPLAVGFRVADDRLPLGERELSGLQRDPLRQTLQRFVARAGINTPVADALARYESAMGLGSGELVAGPLRASFLSTTEQYATYQQVWQGYPVLDYGYRVATKSGIFRGAVGRVVPGLPALAAASVPESAALQSLLTALKVTKAPWLTSPAKYLAPRGELVVAANRQFPAPNDFKLSWRFKLGKGTGIVGASEGRVDATTGKVVSIRGGTVAASSIDLANDVYRQVETAHVVTPYNDARTFSVAAYTRGDGSRVATLASGKIQENGTLATARAVVDSPDPVEAKLEFVTEVTPNGTWLPADEPEEARMAGLQWSLESANDFLDELDLIKGVVPWQNIDGPAAKRRVIINYFNKPSLVQTGFYTYLSDADVAYIAIRNGTFFEFLAPSVVAHEYSHALLNSLRDFESFDTRREPGGINEGLADLFAAAHAQFNSLMPRWHCTWFGAPGDTTPSFCGRDIAAPEAGFYPQPLLYRGPKYTDYSNASDAECDQSGKDSCGVHDNSSMVSHWAYLVAAGSGLTAPSAGSPAACGLEFEAVDPDLTKALQMVTNVAVSAATEVSSTATFSDFRNATMQAAQAFALKYGKPALAEKMALAWAGVGLPADSSLSSNVAPEDDATVSPWVELAWPANGLGQAASSWDLQLATSPQFDVASLKYSSDAAKPISDVTQRYGDPRAFLKLALPTDATATYYWRVRPHQTGAWQSCYPIHSFKTSGVAPQVESMRIKERVVDAKAVPVLVRPGKITATFDNVEQAKEYEVTARTADGRPCEATLGDFSEKTPGCEDCGLEQIIPASGAPWLLPKTSYSLDVRPVGPPDLQGKTSYGECASLAFDTDAMRAPVLGKPTEGGVFADGRSTPAPPPYFEWLVFDGAVKSKLRFFELDEAGACATGAATTHTVDTTWNGTDESLASADGNFLPVPPNPTGYCWDVTGVSGDGVESPVSAPRRFLYKHILVGISPGAMLSDAGGWNESRDPRPLPHAPGQSSYGQDVTLSWQPSPAASAYMVRLDRWEGRQPDDHNHQPANCVQGTFNPYADKPLNGLCNTPKLNIELQRVETSECSATTCSLELPGTDEVSEEGLCDGPSCGRYCWAVWPLFEGADGQEVARKPLVELDRLCYTSDPSKPEITIEAPAALVTSTKVTNVKVVPRFTGQQIKGRIHYDYVPDKQLEFSAKSGNAITTDVKLTGECTPTYTAGTATDAFEPYADLYDCYIDFTITPKPRQTYVINTKVFNEPQVKYPALPKHEAVHDVSLSITNPGCGNATEGCCLAAPYCVAGLGCMGKPGENGVCEECGTKDKKCCQTTDPSNPFPPESKGCDAAQKLNCNRDTKCSSCGAISEQCCQNNRCDEGGRCNESTQLCIEDCNPNLGMPVLPARMTAYQSFCQPVASSASFDSSDPTLTISNCELIGTNPYQLVDQHVISCSHGMSFPWQAVPGAHHYEAYALPYSFPGVPKGEKQLTSTVYTNGSWVAPKPNFEPLLFAVGVRAVDKCGNKGPLAVGMMALSEAPQCILD